jgi:membrane-bound serine protease (ClpP class)
VLAPELSAAAGYTSADTLEDLTGRTGRTLTDLRPSGTVEVDGHRVDVVSEGPFVSSGSTVEVVQSRGAVVVVREVS